VEVLDLPRERFGEASVVMADAFLDDPGWCAVGPDDPARRHRYIRRVCHGILNVVARRGGNNWHVERDGKTVGVTATLDPGQWPPPQISSLAAQAIGPVLGGPRVMLRSLGADNAMHRGHPDDLHFFVWMLTVAPTAQRSGVGRALLSKALERAQEFGVPTHLDTAKPANLPYYRSFGFECVGETQLPRGAPLWFMFRDMR
jgi:ribosomal protein S18 acetylase RimI-like enzyme